MPSRSNGTHANKRLLLSFAHPDDESFGMGGAIAYYATRGVDIALICSTDGDVGIVPPEFMTGYDTVGALRQDELRCAAETLGIGEVITFGYRDSGMMGTPDNNHPDCLWQADEDVVAGRIVREIRRLKPHVIVTFDPYGGYGHPDHIFMHRATTRAFHEAGDSAKYPDQIADGLEPYQPPKLYYMTFPHFPLRVRIWVTRLKGEDPRRLGRNQDIDLLAIADHIPPATTQVNVARYQDTWDAAADCHASQQNPRNTHSFADRLQRYIYRHQDFTRVIPAPNGSRAKERDLFAGVE